MEVGVTGPGWAFISPILQQLAVCLRLPLWLRLPYGITGRIDKVVDSKRQFVTKRCRRHEPSE
jgi:hypothetical protein